MKLPSLFKKNWSKVRWSTTFGISRVDKSLFAVDFVSMPLSQETFDRLGGRYLKHVLKGQARPVFDVGYKFVMPGEILVKNQRAFVLGLPKFDVGKHVVLSKKVVGVSYELTGRGWVITQEVEGKLKV